MLFCSKFYIWAPLRAPSIALRAMEGDHDSFWVRLRNPSICVDNYSVVLIPNISYSGQSFVSGLLLGVTAMEGPLVRSGFV